jgi:hypothetical protein
MRRKQKEHMNEERGREGERGGIFPPWNVFFSEMSRNVSETVPPLHVYINI